MITTENNNNSNAATQSKLICKDHLVSSEEFRIEEYEKGILKTQPTPENLPKYYESEDYISHRDSKSNLQDKVYQMVKSFMLSEKAKWIQSYIEKGSILDYGAGTGEFLQQMKNNAWQVEGVEPNSNARNLGVNKGLQIQSILSAVSKKSYDVISLWHVLEHIPDFENKIVEFKELLDQDGLLVIAVPNYKSYDANYYNENWAAWDVPRHLWHFSREGIKTKMNQYGFSLVEEKPLKFDSYYVSLLSEKNKSTSTNFLNAFYRGLRSNLKAKASGEYSSIAYFFRKHPKTQFKAN